MSETDNRFDGLPQLAAEEQSMSFSLSALRNTTVLSDTRLLIYDNDHDGTLSAGDRIFDAANGTDVALDTANTRIQAQLIAIVDSAASRLHTGVADAPYSGMRTGSDRICASRGVPQWFNRAYTDGRQALVALAAMPRASFALSEARFNEAIDFHNSEITLARSERETSPHTCIDPYGDMHVAEMRELPHFSLSGR